MDLSMAIKAAVTAVLALVLLIPVAMIRDLIAERQARRNEAVGGIALGWGQRQVIAGPFLSVPYERTWTETTQEIVDGKSRERRIERSESRVLRLPVESVHWSIEAATSEKARGIYKARLYSARINVQGSFPEHFDFKAELDVAGGLGSASGVRAQATDLYTQWTRYPLAQLRAGQFKTPYGYEHLFSDTKTLTIERSLASDRIAPGARGGAGRVARGGGAVTVPARLTRRRLCGDNSVIVFSDRSDQLLV